METQTPYTFEEFEEAVRQSFKKSWPTLSDEEVNRYFTTDEAKHEILREYKEGKANLDAGKITVNVFNVGCVSSVAYCLEYMY